MVGALPACSSKAASTPAAGPSCSAPPSWACRSSIADPAQAISPRSLVVGPAAIVIALVLGFEIYGVGGAFYGGALAILGVAYLDAAADFRADHPTPPAPCSPPSNSSADGEGNQEKGARPRSPARRRPTGR